MQSTEQKLREALQKIIEIKNKMEGSDWEEIEEAREIARQALALPTAEQVDDINVAESFTSVTKTAAPVGDLPELPEPAAWRTPDEWPMCYQYTHEEPDAERIQWAARYGRKHEQVFTADQMRAYALSARAAQCAADDVKSVLQSALNVLGCLEYGITGVDSWPCEDSVEAVVHRIRKVLEESQ